MFDPSEGGLNVGGRKRTVYRCDVCLQSVSQQTAQEDLLVCHRCTARGEKNPISTVLVNGIMKQ